MAVAGAPGPARCTKVRLWCRTLLLVAAIPRSRGDTQFLFQPPSRETLGSEDCPSSCSSIFGKLDEGSYNRERRVQVVRVQQRGGMLLVGGAIFMRTPM